MTVAAAGLATPMANPPIAQGREAAPPSLGIDAACTRCYRYRVNVTSPQVIGLALALSAWLSACKNDTPAPATRQAEAPSATSPPPPLGDAAPASPPGTPMQIRLNSTPSGARAFVNGTEIGVTPISHTVVVTGAPVEFTFTLEGYQAATYNFVPQISGEVHGRLRPLPALPTPPPTMP